MLRIYGRHIRETSREPECFGKRGIGVTASFDALYAQAVFNIPIGDHVVKIGAGVIYGFGAKFQFGGKTKIGGSFLGGGEFIIEWD